MLGAAISTLMTSWRRSGPMTFMAEYEGKKPLHLKGAADKFAKVMSMVPFERSFGPGHDLVAGQSLMLVLDKEQVPAQSLLRSLHGRARRRAGASDPIPAKVKDYLQKGATMVANDIDHLSAGLTAFSRKRWSRRSAAKVQGNLYCSSKRRQGFAAHFDTHDVYAVHVEGTKTWHIYEGRADGPDRPSRCSRPSGASITNRPRASS